MKHILITGASTGIGFDLVRRFLKEEGQVWAALRKPEVLSALKNEFPNLKTLKLDVTSSEEIQNALVEILKCEQEISEFILINNAGVALGGPVEYLNIQDWRDAFEVNVFGLFNMTKTFLPLIRKTKGRVINIGSLSGLVATPFLSTYASTKFAVRAFTDSLRREMLQFDVKVVLIQPGPIRTPIWGKSVNKSLSYQVRANESMKKIYGSSIDSLVSSVQKTEKSAIPVEYVSELVVEVVKSSNPKPYYLIGKNIHFLVLFLKIVPLRILDRLLNKGFRFVE